MTSALFAKRTYAAIMRSTNVPEDEKSEKLKSAEKHLKFAEERIAYKDNKKNWDGLLLQYCEHGNSPCCLPISMVYSFDHAQLVHFPSNPLQLRPAYFKMARKCEIFGICCEVVARLII